MARNSESACCNASPLLYAGHGVLPSLSAHQSKITKRPLGFCRYGSKYRRLSVDRLLCLVGNGFQIRLVAPSVPAHLAHSKVFFLSPVPYFCHPLFTAKRGVPLASTYVCHRYAHLVTSSCRRRRSIEQPVVSLEKVCMLAQTVASCFTVAWRLLPLVHEHIVCACRCRRRSLSRLRKAISRACGGSCACWKRLLTPPQQVRKAAPATELRLGILTCVPPLIGQLISSAHVRVEVDPYSVRTWKTWT